MYLYVQENGEAFYSELAPTGGDLGCIRDGILTVYDLVNGVFEVRVDEQGYRYMQRLPEGSRMQHIESGWQYTFDKRDHKHLTHDFEEVSEQINDLPENKVTGSLLDSPQGMNRLSLKSISTLLKEYIDSPQYSGYADFEDFIDLPDYADFADLTHYDEYALGQHNHQGLHIRRHNGNPHNRLDLWGGGGCNIFTDLGGRIEYAEDTAYNGNQPANDTIDTVHKVHQDTLTFSFGTA